jgi:segregation and condensation protein B
MEAVLLTAERGLSAVELAEILRVTVAEVERGLEFLRESYQSRERGFELRETESGYALFTKPEFSELVARAAGGFDQVELTQPALETLAIIAYRGPVARSEISRIRGVQADAMVRNLLAMGLIERSLNPDDARTYLYRLSSYCFEQLGMVDASELPPITPHLPEKLAELGLLNEFEDIRKSRRSATKSANSPTNFSASSPTDFLPSSQDT